MAILTKDQILAAQDLKRETVSVPEWGGEVIVQELTGDQRDAYQASLYGGKPGGELDLKRFQVKLLAFCLVDEGGNPLFSEADIDGLAKKGAKTITKLFNVAQKLNGLAEDSVEQAEGN